MTTDFKTPTMEITLNDAAFLAMTLNIAIQQNPAIATPHVRALYAKLIETDSCN